MLLGVCIPLLYNDLTFDDLVHRNDQYHDLSKLICAIVYDLPIL
jgi:hypothetical protein